MKQLKPINKMLLLYFLFGIIILPILSIYLGTRASILYENLTYIGNTLQYRFLFLVWGITLSLFYCFSYFKVVKLYELKQPTYNYLCIIATCLNIIAMLMPFKNHSGDIFSQLHIYTSFMATLLTCLLIYKIVSKLQKTDFLIFLFIRNSILSLISLSTMCILLLGDFSTLLEIIFTNGISFLFYTLLSLKIHENIK